jgi:hypothetical protein
MTSATRAPYRCCRRASLHPRTFRPVCHVRSCGWRSPAGSCAARCCSSLWFSGSLLRAPAAPGRPTSSYQAGWSGEGGLAGHSEAPPAGAAHRHENGAAAQRTWQLHLALISLPYSIAPLGVSPEHLASRRAISSLDRPCLRRALMALSNLDLRPRISDSAGHKQPSQKVPRRLDPQYARRR